MAIIPTSTSTSLPVHTVVLKQVVITTMNYMISNAIRLSQYIFYNTMQFNSAFTKLLSQIFPVSNQKQIVLFEARCFLKQM